MKKMWLFVFAFGMFFLMQNVYAYQNYYYMEDDGRYMLCVENGACIPVNFGDANVTFDLGKGRIIYNEITYYYDSVKEQQYQKGQAGKSRMYFYKDINGRYVLCSTNEAKSCKTYTLDSLKNIASIGSDKIVLSSTTGPGQSGQTYYFSQDKQDEYDSKFSSKNRSSSDSSNNQTTGNGVKKEEAQPTTDTCMRLKGPLKFLGHIVVIFKIIIPIVLIIMGAFDFFKGVTSGKDEELKKAGKSFLFRVIAAVVIFFLPTIVSLIFSYIDSWTGIKGDFNACQKCVLRVGECQ